MVPKRDRRILLWIVALSLLALATALPVGSALAGELADSSNGLFPKPAAPSTGPDAASTPTLTRTPTSTPAATCVPRAFVNAAACRFSGGGSQRWHASISVM